MNLSIPARVSLTTVSALSILLCVLLAVMAEGSFDFAQRRAVAQLETSMRVAWDVIQRKGRNFEVKDGAMTVDGHVLNGDFASVDHIKQLVGGVATVFSGDVRVTTNVMQKDGTRAVNTQLARGPAYDAVIHNGKPFRGEAAILGEPYMVAYDPIKSASGKVVGILFVGVPKNEYFEPVYRELKFLAFTGGVISLLAALASVFMVRFQLRHLATIRAAMTRIMGGDCSATLSFADRKDDLGRMASAVHAFRDGVQEKARIEREAEAARASAEAEKAAAEAMRAEVARKQADVVRDLGAGLSRLASRDLTVQMSAFPADYAQLEADFNTAASALRDAIATVASNSEAITAGSMEISRAADDLSRRTEQQAASLEQTAAALDEINATGKKTAEGAIHARDVVSTAKADAEETGAIVHRTVEAMGNVEKSAQQISQIIGVIDEIAFQTNLLALNAGVEAARAGDAGRGFAVVASEVRALAQRSAEAAKEIKSLISTSSSHVKEGVDLVAQAGAALQRILTHVTDINAVVLDIAAGAQEQASGLAQVNTAINQMDQATQQNAAMVEQSTAASHALCKEASGLSELLGQFQIGGRQQALRTIPTAKVKPARRQSGSGLKGAPAAAMAAPAEEASWQDF